MKYAKYIILIVIVLAIAAVAWIKYSPAKNRQADIKTAEPTSIPSSPSTETSLNMYVEDNAVVPSDQKPGKSITVNKILLDKPGYVVIHEDSNGEPGDMIGSSSFYEKGEFSDVEVQLTRPAKEGEVLYAMIHHEGNNDQAFDLDNDKPALGKSGTPISASFLISSNAQQVPDAVR